MSKRHVTILHHHHLFASHLKISLTVFHLIFKWIKTQVLTFVWLTRSTSKLETTLTLGQDPIENTWASTCVWWHAAAINKKSHNFEWFGIAVVVWMRAREATSCFYTRLVPRRNWNVSYAFTVDRLASIPCVFWIRHDDTLENQERS